MQNKKHKAVGAAVAMAVAGLVGCTTGDASAPEAAASAAASGNQVDMMHCYGANVCKGHNDCKTAANDCAGQGSCKAEGFVSTPVKACDDIGGNKQDEVIWQASSADLVHCSEVNVCKGHNDCKTATNACAGHGSCKGQGFVALPAKSCTDIGGKIDG